MRRLAAVVVVWPDLSAAWVTPHRQWLDFHLQWRRSAPEHRGLLGSNDDNPANDLTDRGIQVDSKNEVGVRAFVESWRLTDSESLFTYAEGESTATYTLLDFPRTQVPPAHAALAQECCGNLPEGFAKESCIYDVSMTGDRSFAISYQDVAIRHTGAMIHKKWAKARGSQKSSSAGGLQITEAERKGAQGIELGATIKETLPAGQSRVYRFEFPAANDTKLGVLSNELEVRKAYTPDIAGYALFDSEGVRVGEVTAAVNDSPAVELKSGTYFIKIVGPGLIHIKLH